MNLKHRDKLLSDLADEIKKMENGAKRTDIGVLDVQLQDKKGKVLQSGSLGWALDVIANDLYFDEEADWSEAYSVRVGTL